MTRKYQDLSAFRLPEGFRGRPAWFVQLWWLVQASLFRHSPQFAYRFRAGLLRAFGASVGTNTVIRPTVTVTYPWKVVIGDYVWIGDDATLYSLGPITIGSHSVISQRSYLCAGDHEYLQIDFAIRGRAIAVGDECWIAADTFVAPGVSIGGGTVVGARSSVFSNLPGGFVCVGSPCRVVGPRLSTEKHLSNKPPAEH